MADDQNESGATSQEPVDFGSDAVKSLAEAITLVLQQTGKQDSANACTGGSTQSMYRNIKPPRPYSTNQSFKTWLSQFLEYAKLVNIPDDQKRAYVVNLLDEKAYKAMELLQLPETLSFDEFISKLKSRFESARTKEDYKLQLRSRYQKPGEDFESFADALLELVENAYPEAVFDFKVELARDRFLQGITVSDETREKLFISQPKTLSESVRVVRQIESARKASQSCKTPSATPRMKAQCHAVSEDKLSSELKEMKELMMQMNERIKQLESQPRNQNRWGSQVCYTCGEVGHFARNCTHKNPGNGPRGLAGSNHPSNKH